MKFDLFLTFCRAALGLALLLGWAGGPLAWAQASGAQAGPAVATVVPAGVFKALPAQPTRVAPPSAPQMGQAAPMRVHAWLYLSASNNQQLAAWGVEAPVVKVLWERFLRRYHIPFKTIDTPAKIDAAQPGVLILASQVALSRAEMQAVAAFRDRGGSVLSTWLSGVRSERGDWLGFDFMRESLDVNVLGDTAERPEINFMMPLGQTPLTQHVPAGDRIWTDRVAGQYPVLLQGQETAAYLMDWSRQDTELSAPVVSFGEKRMPSGLLSRSVAFGTNERIWASGDARQWDALTYDALAWLLRQTSAQLAVWPAPFGAAASFIMDAPEVMDELDVEFAKRVEQLGARFTLFVPGVVWEKSKNAITTLTRAGHVFGFQGDKFEAFKGQTEETQRKRLQLALALAYDQGTQPARGERWLSPPLDAIDATTLRVLADEGFGACLVFSDQVDHRLPKLMPGPPADALVLLPQTLAGPEELIAEGDPQEGAQAFLRQFDLSLAAGGWTMVKFPNQSLIPPEQLSTLFTRFAQEKSRTWWPSVPQVVAWSRYRAGAQAEITSQAQALDIKLTLARLPPAGTQPMLVLYPPRPDAQAVLVRVSDGQRSPMQALGRFQVQAALAGLKTGDNLFRVEWSAGHSTGAN